MTEEEYNSMSEKEQEEYYQKLEEEYRESIEAMSPEEREAYENYSGISEKEMAERYASEILYYGSLRTYTEEKEKKQGWLSQWKNHQIEEDEHTYHSIEYHNNSIIDKSISKIKSDLDLIIEQVKKNSSEELIERKIFKLKEKFDDYPNCFKDCVEYIHRHIEESNLANLGHTKAWLYLDKYLDNLIGIKERAVRNTQDFITPLHTNGDLETLHSAMKIKGFIDKDYSLKDFKECFKGKLFKEINPIKFNENFEGTSRVLLFDRLHKEGFIKIFPQKTMDRFLGIKEGYYKALKSKFKNINIDDTTEYDNTVANLLEIRMILRSFRTTK